MAIFSFLLQNDVTETKGVKIVSILSTIHTNILVDSGKINREANEPIRKQKLSLTITKQ